jgi:hypothetical protein
MRLRIKMYECKMNAIEANACICSDLDRDGRRPLAIINHFRLRIRPRISPPAFASVYLLKLVPLYHNAPAVDMDTNTNREKSSQTQLGSVLRLLQCFAYENAVADFRTVVCPSQRNPYVVVNLSRCVTTIV